MNEEKGPAFRFTPRMGKAPRRGARRVLRVLLLLFLLAGAAVVVLWERCGLNGCPDVDRLRGYMPDQASVVVDRDGQEVGKLYVTRRVVVALDSLPEYVPNAF